MEVARDQVTQDQLARAWASFSEVEQGALLVELSASLRRRLMVLEIDLETVRAYRLFSHASRCAGQALINKHRIPFVPEPPFQWSRLHMNEVEARVPEITSWSASTVIQDQQPLPVRHTALDLSQAGQELERQLERTRTR